jgi:hypothetical protein
MENILTNYDNNFDANELKTQIDEYFRINYFLMKEDKTNIIINVAEDINEKYGHNKAQEIVDTLINELNEKIEDVGSEMVSNMVNNYMCFYDFAHTLEEYDEEYNELKKCASVLFQKYDIIPKEYKAIDDNMNIDEFMDKVNSEADIEINHIIDERNGWSR